MFAKRKRILVADDEEEICFFLKRFLERKNFKVSLALDGAQAKKIIDKEKFDFLLLDCSMPELTGFELVQSARKRNPTAKIVLASGFPSVDSDLVQKLGADLFIHKPIQLSEIDKILQGF